MFQKYINHLLGVVFFFAVGNVVVAQGSKASISGNIIDAATENPIVFATIILLEGEEGNFVNSEYTDDQGAFQFQDINFGNYKLRIVFDGYTTLETGMIEINETNRSELFSNLKLLRSIEEQQLDEVVIVKKKEFVERKIDRTVLNVDALQSNAGLTALELLEKSPGVSVSDNGTVSLRGKSGVTIFINDRPTYLSGSELENYLNGLSSDVLEKIEIMTNPPAKYDAAGNAGVINIKLKKNKNEGENGSFILGLRQHRYTEYNGSLNYNKRKGKYNFFTNVSVGYKKRYQDIFIDRDMIQPDGTVGSFSRQETNNVGDGVLANAKLGIDYNLSEKTIIGAVVDGLFWNGNDDDESRNEVFNSSQNLDSVATTLGDSDMRFINTGANLNLDHKFTEKRSLSVNLDYLLYDTDPEQKFTNTISFTDGSPEVRDILTGASDSQINIYSGKLDYSDQITERVSLETGVKHSFVSTENKSDYIDIIDNVSIPNLDQSNEFLYDENITSAYVNSNINLDRLSIQLGLRYENTNVEGEQVGNSVNPKVRNDNQYDNWFPTAYLSYKLDSLSHSTVGINYGKRIDRPFYRDLNPIVFQVDKFTFYEGNPFLQPSLTNSIEVFYSYKSLINLTAGYSKIDDQVQETIEIVDGVYFSRPGNIGETEVTNISLSSSFDIAPWLSFTGYAEMSYVNSTSDFFTGRLQTDGYNFRIDPILQFKLPKDWNIEWLGRYVGKSYIAQFVTKPYWFTDLTVSKKLSTKSSLKLVFTDIFNTNINQGDINNLANTQAFYKTLRNTQQIRLSFSYKFGSGKAKRRASSNSIDQEKGRIK